MGPGEDALAYVGIACRRPFLPGLAGEAVGLHLAQVAADTINVMEVFALAVNEVTEGAFGRTPATVDCLGPVEGGFTQHIVLAGTFHGLDEAGAPVEDFVAVGQHDDGYGAVDVFARLHGLDSLGRVKPGLGKERKGVYVAGADFVERGVGVARVELGLPALIGCETGDAFRFAIAEGDTILRAGGS